MRAAFKSQGWGHKEISVRSSNYSMGSSVRISIKSPVVDRRVAEQIAGCEESISRCEITHEILGGGNFFVTVAWDYEVAAEMAKPWMEPIKAALAQVKHGETRLIPVNGAESVDACVGYGAGSWLAQLWVGRHVAVDFTPDFPNQGAFTLALKLAEQEAA